MEESGQKELALKLTSEKTNKLFLWPQRYNKSRARMFLFHAVKDKDKLPITQFGNLDRNLLDANQDYIKLTRYFNTAL